jgi:hypothetical protein
VALCPAANRASEHACEVGQSKQAQPWWVTPNDFGALEFYSPKSLTGRNNGWVGIAPDGRIFVSTGAAIPITLGENQISLFCFHKR